MEQITTLFLAANPVGTSHLALDEEIREITQKIRMADGRDVLQVISSWAVRPDDLLQYLNQHKPHIVHFSGHGSHDGELILLDNQRRPKPVSPVALKALFATLKDNIQIVVLNACFSRLQGEAINEVIDFVVGMDKAIGDQAAITFAASFYRALGFNRSVQDAFEQARTALLLEGIPEESTPQLLIREGVNPSQKVLAGNINSGQPAKSTPAQLKVELDKIAPFEIVEGNTRIIYSDAGEHEGTLVSGRGHRLLVSFVNEDSSPVIIRSVRLRLIGRELNHPTLRYNKMMMTVPHTRLPIETIQAPIYLQDSDSLQSSKEIGEGRVYLGASGALDSTHQMSFTAEARSPGLWIYQLEAEYIDPRTGKDKVAICKDKLKILLRGK